MITSKMTPVDPCVRRIVEGSLAVNPHAGLPANDCEREPNLTVVGRAAWGSRMSTRPRRIVVGMDFSPAAESARRLALGIALASDALVDVVHVFDAFTETFLRNNIDALDNPERLLGEIDQALLRRERMALAQGVRCVHHGLVGAPGAELARHAAITETDLIVLGDAGEEPGRFGWTWGRLAAEQIRHNTRWRGLVLLRPTPGTGR